MTNPTLERAARAACVESFGEDAWSFVSESTRQAFRKQARAMLMAVLPTLERYDSDYAGEYQDDRGDYVKYADLQAILNDGEGE